MLSRKKIKSSSVSRRFASSLRRRFRGDREGRLSCRPLRLNLEPLEERSLLSVILWNNRGANGGADSDNFVATYGAAVAPIARTIVDRAIDNWESVIANFNYAGGGNTYALQVTAADLGGGGRGLTNAVTVDASGKPTSATITLDDDGGGDGWYFDPVIADDAEFTTLVNTFTANGLAALGGNDFYRTIVHELGHAMGISVGGSLAINNFLADTGVADPVSQDAGPPTEDLYVFTGASVSASLTAVGGGHIYEGPAPGSLPNLPIAPFDLMNAGRTVGYPPPTRELISDLDASILYDAYGYAITLPSTLNTFFANLNVTDGVLTINGTPGTSDDQVTIDRNGAALRVVVNGTQETFDGASVTSLNILTGDGNDSISIAANVGLAATIDPGTGNDHVVTGSGATTVVSAAGDGNDIIDFTNNPVGVTFTVNGGDSITGSVFDDTLIVDTTAGLITSPIYFNGGSGKDRLILQQTGGPTRTSSTIYLGANPGQGQSVIVDGETTQRIYFENIEPLTEVIPAATFNISSVAGLASLLQADNAINYESGQILGPTAGRVTVDNFEPIEFTGKTTLVIDAGAGSDTINLNNPNTPTGLTNITVNGGDPTASDVLVVNGIAGVLDDLRFMPTSVGAGTVTNDSASQPQVALTGVEHLKIVVQQVDGDGVRLDGTAGNDNIEYHAGATADTGIFTGTMDLNNTTGLGPFQMVEMTFFGVNSAANDQDVNFFNPGGTDQFIFNGTDVDDAIAVGAGEAGGTEFRNTLNAQVVARVEVFNIGSAIVRGGAGDDVFSQSSDIAVPVSYEGGGSSEGDVLTITGTSVAELAAVNLALRQISGFGGTISVTSIEQVVLIGNGGTDTLDVTGTTVDDSIDYTPTSASGGQFRWDGLNTQFVFDIGSAAANLFTIHGGGGTADQLVLYGTNGRDTLALRADLRTASVLDASGVTRKPVTLAGDVQQLTALGLGGQDMFQVTPAAGIQYPIHSNLDNLLIHVDGGNDSNNALVVQSSVGGTLDATQFVVVNRDATANAGTVRVFTAAVQWPDIDYQNVQVVSPKVALVGNQPNLLIMGPDIYEGDEFQANAAFLGSGATLQIQHASIFPNFREFPGVPSDNDYYRVVTQTTGTLDFQVYFKLYSTTLLPNGGNLNLEVLDENGNVIAAAPGAFGTVGGTANARVRVPAVAGNSYYLHVFGQLPGEGSSGVVNGYDATIINTANPVPSDLELSRSVAAPIAGNPDTGDLPANAPDSDTGRSQFDNVTHVNNPTIYLRLDDAIFLQDLPGNQTPGGVSPMGAIPIPFNSDTTITTTTAGFRIAVYDGGNGSPAAGNPHALDANDSTFIGFAQPVAGVPHLYVLTIGSQGVDRLADGLHYLTARVQMVDPAAPTETGFGDRSLSLQMIVDTAAPPVFFGTQASVIDGIDPAHTDTGVQSYPATFVDRVTSDTHTGFWGRAEADSIVRVYSDQNNNGVVDAGDLLLGETTAIPLDGTNAFSNGQWNLTTTIDLNDPAFFPHDGTRNLLVTAEDLAGNVSTPDALKIFIDTQGPQVSGVQITGNPGYHLFGLKPDNASQGPTPLTNSLTINIVDQPNRDTINFPDYVALLAAAASTPGTFVLTGDANGVIVIQQVIVTNNPTVNGQPATATIQLIFAQPLPDDRFTLTIHDANVVDPAGNQLDGESNAQEPNGSPTFASGNGEPGGDFVARFTVDSRPEIGTWSAGNVYVDTNGNFYFDETNADATNRDIIYEFAVTTDTVFAGNFSPIGAATADGFDKLAAYGRFNGQARWLIDTNNDGVADIVLNDPANLNAIPVAGNFDGNAADGDEVGLFDGTYWYFDTNHDDKIDLASRVTSTIIGYPIVGDFDGDGHDDLGTYRDDTFYFQLWNGSTYAGVQTITTLSSIGVRERPVAADMDRDGIDDIGLWVPDRSGATGDNIGEWYFLVSNDSTHAGRIAGQVNTLNHGFSPTPLGHDLYARFGNQFAMPIVGNFDPPAASVRSALQSPPTMTTIGVYQPGSSKFYLRDTNSAGVADNAFVYGPAGSGWIPLSGDWNGDGVQTPGLYNSSTATFYLRNSNDAGAAELKFVYGPTGGGWIPIVGDWDNDGDETIGLFNPITSKFYLRNTNDAGPANLAFVYGPTGANWTPIIGDWNGDGEDTIGLYSATTSKFYLRNTNAAGVADISFVYGPESTGWTPLAGDWNADGLTTIGLYRLDTSTFYLRNSNTPGPADSTFVFGGAGNTWMPLVGTWTSSSGLIAAQGVAATNDSAGVLAQADLRPIIDEAIARWADAGLDEATLARLARADFAIADLPGAYLGKTVGDQIFLDIDAAGHGWFVDPTPSVNEEFTVPQNPAKRLAIDPDVLDRIDLLSVVEHELGHVAGFGDLDAVADSLMSDRLSTGIRWLP